MEPISIDSYLYDGLQYLLHSNNFYYRTENFVSQ
jgi:hypothetical protein